MGFNPEDLILVDHHSLGTSGVQTICDVIKNIRLLNSESCLYCLIDNYSRERQALFKLGICDYIATPLIAEEIARRFKQSSTREHVHTAPQCENNIDSPGCSQLSFDFGFNGRSLAQLPRMQPNRTESKHSLMATKLSSYLSENLDKSINLSELAQAMHTNRNTLSTAFKDHYGLPIFSWLREQRMERAAQLLMHTPKSVQTISMDVGYQDPNNFSTTFKRTYACSPLQYKKMYCAKK